MVHTAVYNVLHCLPYLTSSRYLTSYPWIFKHIKELLTKHPEGEPVCQVLNQPCVIYDDITSDSIMKTARRTNGSAGPSHYDADDWRTILGSSLYGTEAEDFIKSLAALARELCINGVDDPETSKHC